MSENTRKLLIGAFAVLGMITMVYLAYLKLSAGVYTFCDISEGLSCTAVNQSIYSEFLGIPISILGFGYFLIILLILLRGVGSYTYQLIILLSIPMLLMSLYLSYIEFFIIRSICIFCEFSKILMLAILATALWQLRTMKVRLKVNYLAGVLFAGILGIGLMYLSFRGPTIDKNYDAFARCLTEEGWAMYGTYWCPNCARQKQLFGDSFTFIEEVECDPRGENPQVDRCLERNLKKTPTWFRESENNEEEFESLIGVQSLEQLSTISGCPLEVEEEN